MTVFQQAHFLFDAADREAQAGRLMALADRQLDAARHFQRESDLKAQAGRILDQVMLDGSGTRIA